MRCPCAWLIILALAAMPLSGCNPQTRYRFLSKIFEDVPKPGEEVQHKPVVRNMRRAPPQAPAIPPPPVKVVQPETESMALKRGNWRETLRQFPKDSAGGLDWNHALTEKFIEPKAGLKPDSPDQPVFDLNVELIPEGQALFKVTFPHKAHTQWLACANCHTAIFKMQRGANPITMAKIFAGEYCGHCHGKVSFAVPTGCPRCHLALAGPTK